MNKIILISLFTLLTFANERISLEASKKTEIIKMLEVNEQLHSAFFDYDAKKVEESAKALSESIGTISTPEVKKLLKYSQMKLKDIKASNSESANKQKYHIVSMALIHIVNKYEVGKYNAYSCPMVKQKWVQNSAKQDKVHNPYAANMPHCGQKDTNF